MNKHGITGKLKVGDIVKVHNPLLKDEFSEYPVKKIEGNRAITDFRIFNRKIYHGRIVYEYGKKYNPLDNGYTVINNNANADKK